MDERYDRAVVFVHGIGTHDPGRTLDRFGSPFAAYAIAHHGPESKLERTEGAWILRLVDGDRVTRWRLVEVHWDDVVASPTYFTLLRWMVLVAPWMLHADALLWSQRRHRVSHRRSIGWWAGVGTSWWAMRIAWSFTRGMALLTAGLIAQLVLTLIGIVGLIPALRRPAIWVERQLVASVGDSFAYLFDAETWARIETRLVDTVELAGASADEVAVVTHSQGTALLHRALAHRTMPDVITTWISVGSGLQKLIAVRLLSTRELAGWAALRFVALVIFFGTIPLWEYVQDPATGEQVPSSLVGFAVLVATAALVAPYFRVRRLRAAIEHDVLDPLPDYSLTWLDLYTFHDPVPGGPMPGSEIDSAASRPTSVEVFNEGSFRTDHSTYASNFEHVVGTVHERLCPSPTDPMSRAQSMHRRVRRVRARRALRLLAVGAGLGVVMPIVRVAPARVGVLSFAAGIWLAVAVTDRAWHRWNEREATASLTPRRPPPSIRPTLWVVTGVTVLALIAVGFGTAGIDIEQVGGPLRFGAVWSRGITLFVGPLALVLIATADYRAYNAALKDVTPPTDTT